MSTAATSAIDEKKDEKRQKGVVISKLSALSDEQLERMLRQKFRKQGRLFADVIRNVKFDVIEKNVRGTVMTSKVTESRKRIETEWQKIRGPSAASYAVKEDVVKQG